ncbi:hypothetical protein RYZ26_15070 [Terasakiella sp. A23]|uniref:hypothetical protein n=1 Tax=Terasakiella sp. FCG-A23 TaxID=3080561 RepID=UPI0029551E52|nr:hypothetical protein [Terasakiella sp. A23]MDV7340927.1 hypothetical protein [Terasakiella sp. A23]
MTQNTSGLSKVADNLQESAEKVEDGINNVLEPEIKETRISSHDTKRLMQNLYNRVVLLFAASVAINGITLLIIMNG